MAIEPAEIQTAKEATALLGLPDGALPPGHYVVTDGWMLRRLKMEQSIRAALKRCACRTEPGSVDCEDLEP